MGEIFNTNNPLVIGIGLFGMMIIVSAQFAWKIAEKWQGRNGNGNGKLEKVLESMVAVQKIQVDHMKSTERKEEHRELIDTMSGLRGAVDGLSDIQRESKNAILAAIRRVDEKVDA